MAVHEQLELANQHRRAGRLGQAGEIYQQILVQHPEEPIALFFMAVISQQLRQMDVALDYLRRAAKAKPDFAEAQCNLGALLAAMNRSDEAIGPLRAAVQIQPANVDALFNLATALSDCEQYEEAVTVFGQVIGLRDHFPEAHYELGNALVNIGRLNEAIGAYERAIKLDTNFADALCNLGASLSERGEYERAIAMAQRTIGLAPQNAVAYSNLADALRHVGRYDEAIAACGKAISIRPDFAESYVNLAAVLLDQGKLGEAVDVCRRAIARNLQSAEVHAILSELLREQKQLDEAEKQAQQAIAYDPKFAVAHRNLGNIYKDEGKMSEAVESFRRAVELRPGHANIGSTLAFAVNYSCDFDAGGILHEARGWAERHERPLAGQRVRGKAIDASNRRLRIGYVSGDFHHHPVARSLLAVMEKHDHQRFEIFCYSNSIRQDGLTDKLRACADSWRDVAGMSDEKLAEKIGKDGIDILVDLSLHTGGNRLPVFARRPAPVQVTWLGYPGTTGMANMDYRLSDPYLDPLGENEQNYSERTILLPHSFWCFREEGMRDAPAVQPLPALKNGFVTFGCLNNFCKINEPLLELWRRVLEEVRGSRMLILAAEGGPREWVRGILGERVDFVPHAPRGKYLEYYQRIDIGLDTLPYGGHTTSFDSLWMGVPVLSLVGKTVVGRAGLSLLSNIGLAELVAETADDFVEMAGRWAGDLERLAKLRASLRDRCLGSPLMDGEQFAKGIEKIYLDIAGGEKR